MKPYVYQEGMSYEEQAEGAYWERNMLALFLAQQSNALCEEVGAEIDCGYFYHNEWEGWSRVISLHDGDFTFHVPDNFDLGNLPKIEPNWNGHTTEEKWNKIMDICGIIRNG